MESAPPCSPSYSPAPKTPEIAPSFCLDCKLHPCECKASKKQKREEEEVKPLSDEQVESAMKELTFERLRKNPEWLVEFLQKQVQLDKATIEPGHLLMDLRVEGLSHPIYGIQVAWAIKGRKPNQVMRTSYAH